MGWGRGKANFWPAFEILRSLGGKEDNSKGGWRTCTIMQEGGGENRKREENVRLEEGRREGGHQPKREPSGKERESKRGGGGKRELQIIVPSRQPTGNSERNIGGMKYNGEFRPITKAFGVKKTSSRKAYKNNCKNRERSERHEN